MADFRITLAAARVNAGFTQREVAERMLVTANTVNNWENGKATPSIVVARRLADLYGLDLDYIFFPEEAN